MAEKAPEFVRATEEQLKARYEVADLAELEAFANGEGTDMTLAVGWEEEEQRDIARQVLANRKG